MERMNNSTSEEERIGVTIETTNISTSGNISKESDQETTETSPEEGGSADAGEMQPPPGMVMMEPGIRSPMQTRVRRMTAELRLSATSNVSNLKKVGKGFSSGIHSVANKLPLPTMPKSFRRRSWNCDDDIDEDTLLDPADIAPTTPADKNKSKSSDNLTGKTKNDCAIKANSPATTRTDKTFLRRKWETRKSNSSKDQSDGGKDEQSTGDGDISPTSEASTTSADLVPLPIIYSPVIFEPLMIGQRPLTPTVTVCLDDATGGDESSI